MQSVIVVVGASLSALRACEQLRRDGFGGRILVVGGTDAPFYDRPPLSKEFLQGRIDADALLLRPTSDIEALDLELLPEHLAVGLDLSRHVVELDDERTLSYDGLVVATGATPRWPGGLSRAEGVMTLRTSDDARELRDRLGLGPLAIVGGGFLGMEVAASARRLGVSVTLIEALALPLLRPLGTLVGSFLRNRHEDEGVRFVLGRGVARLEQSNGGHLLVLDDGAVVEAATVLVAVGVEPETSWLSSSGLHLEDGVVCDQGLFCAPQVVAAGDVCRFPSPQGPSSIRIEHWTNAAEQGAHAAGNLLRNEHRAYRPVPYFWSDQYDLKLQAIGLPSGRHRTRVVAGSLEDGEFVLAYEHGGRLVGAVSINKPRQLMALRPLVEQMAPEEQVPVR